MQIPYELKCKCVKLAETQTARAVYDSTFQPEHDGMSEIVQITKYGEEVFCDLEADNMRRERCLCWKCSRLHPGEMDNCCYAQKLFDVCKEGLATMVTRCKYFTPKE